MAKKNEKNLHNESVTAKNKNGFIRFVKTLGRWAKRMFLGASRELTDEEKFAVENLESPSKLAVKAFFRRKLAVAALVVLVSLFLFVFIGPYFIPMNLSYTDPLQANIAPNYSMLSVPKELQSDIKDINGIANFTVGVSNSNTLYMWGFTKDALSGNQYDRFPAEIKEGNVLFAAAGSDHVIAITTEGKIVGWGNGTNGQYGYVRNPDDPYMQMPVEFIEGTIDATKVQQLICGYQATGLILDGKLYLWGNEKTLLNMTELAEKYSEGVQKIAFSNYYGLVLFEDGTVTAGNSLSFQGMSAASSKGQKIKNLKGYLEGKKIVDIAATNNCYALLADDGELIVFGAVQYDENKIPALNSGDRFVSVKSGIRHFAATTQNGLIYTWGHNDGGQASISGVAADKVFTGSKQTYVVDENDDLTQKAGLKGYIFGTDNLGRDTFTRIVHGGKMTMTIGAVAVIVSSLIAIIVGCLSGYFGGWVDMLLMRITEIFSAIPFLPFAMMLSYVIRTMPIDETTRIFIIMVILGLLSWTGLARMIRAQVLSEREKEFVIAAQSMGVKEGRIAFKHILPNVISVILVSMTLDFAGCLLTESSLSYLGFGVQQPQPTWGNMLNGANNSIVIQNYWWQWLFPSIFLAIATISINIIGDTLRDVLDPKSSQEK